MSKQATATEALKALQERCIIFGERLRRRTLGLPTLTQEEIDKLVAEHEAEQNNARVQYYDISEYPNHSFELEPPSCFHEWKRYTGLIETYDYCVHCDEKAKVSA